MRGFVFMLEAVFAGLLLIGFMLFIAHTYSASGSVAEQDFGWVLPELDQKGLLRGYAYSGDRTGLEGEITLYGFEDSVQFCSPGSGCSGSAPEGENVWASSYFLSGDSSFDPREVRLYVQRA